MRPANDVFGDLLRTLFGSNAIASASRELDINERTIRYWLKGRKPVPATVWRELLQLSRVKQKALDFLSGEAHDYGSDIAIAREAATRGGHNGNDDGSESRS